VGQDDADSMKAMEAAFEQGINHLDTATGYGKGHSEELVGRFIKDKREQVFVATKVGAMADGRKYTEGIEASLKRLDTDYVDLYYIHWPKTDVDLRPTMEALEKAREQGKVRAIGVSNFSPEQMDQISEVGTINAHQLCYNLVWRYDENDVIPYCREHEIAMVTYSSIAQGILTGKFPREPKFEEGDVRASTIHFDPEVWPKVYEGVEQLKAVAERAGRPLVDLAIRWVAAQPGVANVLVGVRNDKQLRQNVEAMSGEVSDDVLAELTRISDQIVSEIPDVGNIFRYYP
jgi:aryl-alcohol dehydrogenase-like predicted oxidoreductase